MTNRALIWEESMHRYEAAEASVITEAQPIERLIEHATMNYLTAKEAMVALKEHASAHEYDIDARLAYATEERRRWASIANVLIREQNRRNAS